MKQLKPILIAIICSITQFAYGTIQSFTFEFDESDFEIKTRVDGLTEVISLNDVPFFLNNDDPALPMFSTHLTLSAEYEYVSYSIKRLDKRLVKTGVKLAPNYRYKTLEELETFGEDAAICSYLPTQYPQDSFKCVTSSSDDDATLVYARYCPFVYDARTDELCFVDKLEVELCIEEKADDVVQPATETVGVTKSGMSYQSHFGGAAQWPLDSIPAISPALRYDVDYDYLIITNEALKSAFEPLVRWKESKGVKTRITTVESIYSSNEKDKPLKIKKYIWEMKCRYGIQYVLLGGDDTVVPVRYCFGENTRGKCNYITTDLYYACLGRIYPKLLTVNGMIPEPDKNFSWNLNGNRMYGEFSDSIDMTPKVYLSRLPVRTVEDVTACINKVIRYERSPVYNHRMLNVGAKLWGYYHPDHDNPGKYDPADPLTHSDSEVESDNIYFRTVKPYWSGQRKKLFDTNTDFSGGRDYECSPEHFQMQMSIGGYDFISVFAHGEEGYCTLENEKGYDVALAKALNSSHLSIMTSISCHNNAFDSWNRHGQSGPGQDPCMSEAYIRNPNSGIVAFLGNSRDGLVSVSYEYEGMFYKYLFSDELPDKNFARVVAAAKMAKIPESSEPDENGSVRNGHRWIQFCLNPIGDPEMPIYTKIPKRFDSLMMETEGDEFVVSTGVEGCRICVKGLGESLYHEVVDNVSETKIPLNKLPEKYSVCVTKQNYIPVLYSVSNTTNAPVKVMEVVSTEQMMKKDMGLSELNAPCSKILKCSYDAGAALSNVIVSLDESVGSAQIVVASLTGNIEKTVEIIKEEDVVSADIIGLSSGVHVISLIVDGQSVDSSRLIVR